MFPQYGYPQPAQRAHTPEPNPNYNGGQVHAAPRIASFVNGVQTQVATAPDVVSNFQVTYAQRKAKQDPRTGQVRQYVYLWGRVNKSQCMGINVRGDEAVLAAAAQLQRGQIVSFQGSLAVGTRQNGRPDMFMNARTFFDVKQGEVTVPLAAPAQFAAPQAYTGIPVAANGQPLVAQPAYVPAQTVAAAPVVAAPADAQTVTPEGSPF